MSAKPRRGARRRASEQARPPHRALGKRVGRWLPTASRALALLLFAALVGGLVSLVHGPWLRVAQVASAGERFTASHTLEALLAPYRGTPLLSLDSVSLEARLRQLPAVAEARVRAELPDRLSVEISEKPPAFTWLTPAARLVVAADGSVIGQLARDDGVPDDLAALPTVDDQRSGSRRTAVGDTIPAAELRATERLLAIDPGLIGSAASRFVLRIDDEYGFLLVSRQPPWRAALGFYQLDPSESEAAAVARLDAQVSAVRTLFATQPEASITWVDARNPGKVYWAR